MKRTLMHPLFLLAIFLAGANQFAERVVDISVPVVHCYLDDLLCFPIVLTLGLAAYRAVIPEYRLTGWHIWPLVLTYSVYFEWYLPSRSGIYTSDILDVVMYACGAVLFQLFINSSGPDLDAARLQNS